MALWAYALRTDDAAPLTALGPTTTPCRGCRSLATTMRQRRRQGWSVDFGGLRVRAVQLVQQGGGRTVARAKVDIPRSSSYNADGSFRNTNPAHPGATFEVLMGYTHQRYRLLAFTVS